MKRLWAVVALLCVIGTPVHARPKHYVVLDPACNVTMPCEGGYYSARAKKFIGSSFGVPLQHYVPQQPRRQIVPRLASRTRVVDRGTVIGSRPAGCPRAYCGCSASLYLFGKIRADLNLAANWLRKFPRAAPAPRMAAARPGHVFVLVEHKGGSNWLVHDGNSGRGLTRLHVRSIAGYTVVNPHS